MADLTLRDLDLGYLADAQHFHLSSLFLQRGLHPGLPAFLQKLKAAGLTLSLDTNDDPDDLWDDGLLESVFPHIEVLLPNEQELLRIAKRSTLYEALSALVEEDLTHRREVWTSRRDRPAGTSTDSGETNTGRPHRYDRRW